MAWEEQPTLWMIWGSILAILAGTLIIITDYLREKKDRDRE